MPEKMMDPEVDIGRDGLNKCPGGRMEKWMDEWKDGKADESRDEWMGASRSGSN